MRPRRGLMFVNSLGAAPGVVPSQHLEFVGIRNRDRSGWIVQIHHLRVRVGKSRPVAAAAADWPLTMRNRIAPLNANGCQTGMAEMFGTVHTMPRQAG